MPPRTVAHIVAFMRELLGTAVPTVCDLASWGWLLLGGRTSFACLPGTAEGATLASLMFQLSVSCDIWQAQAGA